MAKGKGKSRPQAQQAQAAPSPDVYTQFPHAQSQGEAAYGPGFTPSLYNGVPSVIQTPTPGQPAQSSGSGQFSPSAAPGENSNALFAPTQASMMPPGAQNPMTIYAIRTRPYFQNGGNNGS